MVFSLRKSFKNRCRLGSLEVKGHTATVNGKTEYTIRLVVFHGVFRGRVVGWEILCDKILENEESEKLLDGTSLQLGKVLQCFVRWQCYLLEMHLFEDG